MSVHQSHIRPDSYIFLRLPTETLRLIEIKLNTIIEVGKLGSFPSNLLLGRPYHYTYEILDKQPDELYSRLRLVTPEELHAEAALDEATPAESRTEPATPGAQNGMLESYDLSVDEAMAIMKNNRLTIDDASRQTLTHEDIEELKKTLGGKEVIEKILASHTGLSEKTAFAKAKYTLRKHKKYLKRFAVLPMNLSNLMDYVTEKDPPRIMEFRLESLGLVMAWGHVHFCGFDTILGNDEATWRGGRWLTADDTGGLLVAGLAERMNLLYPPLVVASKAESRPNGDVPYRQIAIGSSDGDASAETNVASTEASTLPRSHRDFPPPALSNTITLLHPATQPNVSLLKYFGYDTSNPTVVDLEAEHPLHTHLKPLSWLQLLHPDQDPTYCEPETASEETLASWKSGKRGNYFKKRRRWERCKAIVDDARAGEFDGLVIASHMDPVSVLRHTVPLVRGGGNIVLYSPNIEPLVKLMDMYSKDRRAAYIAILGRGETPDQEDFPLDPRLLLAPSLQTSRVRDWQVLPGRTHPLMTGRGGAEGFVFTARRAVPLEGGVEARGNFAGKKRKATATDLEDQKQQGATE